MVQAKSIKALYDVEGMSQNKFSKLDLLPAMYANDYDQEKVCYIGSYTGANVGQYDALVDKQFNAPSWTLPGSRYQI